MAGECAINISVNTEFVEAGECSFVAAYSFFEAEVGDEWEGELIDVMIIPVKGNHGL